MGPCTVKAICYFSTSVYTTTIRSSWLAEVNKGLITTGPRNVITLNARWLEIVIIFSFHCILNYFMPMLDLENLGLREQFPLFFHFCRITMNYFKINLGTNNYPYTCA